MYLVTFLRVTLLFRYDQMPHGLINIAVESVLICMLNKCRLPYINISNEDNDTCVWNCSNLRVGSELATNHSQLLDSITPNSIAHCQACLIC